MTPTVVILLAASGACFGSFAVTAGLRATSGAPWIGGRSRCDHCATAISYRQSIPVVSYALSRGRCAACQGTITVAHPIAESLGAALLPLCLFAFDPLRGVLIFFLALLLATASMIDLRTLRLPDGLTLGVAGASLVLSALGGLWALATGVLAAGVVFTILQGLRCLARWRRTDPGLGFGDVKLLAALALWLGIATPWAVLLAAIAGLLVIVVHKPAEGRLPFGPFIAGGALVVGILRDAGLLGLVA
jgi:leader peptidase (prepilin peptidase)/N-methyltransferase